MKKLTLFLVAMTMSLLSFAQTQMSGTYTVGTGGSYDYSSMADAGMAIKEAEFTGDVTLLICTDLTETINTGIVNKSEYTLTIRPDKDENRTITYTTATDNTGPTGVFVIGGDMTKTPGSTIGWASVPTKNVIVDGAAEGKTTPRLKITNEKWGTNVLLYGEVQDVIIRNCILVGRSSSTAYALAFRSENYSKTSKNIGPKNCVAENCIIESASTQSQVVYCQGNQANSYAGYPTNITIRNCSITSHLRGIFLYGVNNFDMEGCVLKMLETTAGYMCHGVLGTTTKGVINIKGNKFIKNTTKNASAGEYGLQTITASGGATEWVIENNYFAGYDALASGTTSKESRLVGIRCGDYCVVRHNTFHMPKLTYAPGTSLVGTHAVALLWLAGSHKYPVQNNIFVCEETAANVSLIRGGLNENVTGNVFYHNGGKAAIVAAAPSCMTFADLETSYSAQAATSKWTNVTFTDAANGDLSLAGNSNGDETLAVSRLAEVLTDITGKSRREQTYAGAYEGANFPSNMPSSITLTAYPVQDYSASIVGTMKRAIQNGENTIVLTHEADGTPHIYSIEHSTKTVTELSQEGVVAVNPDNANDYLAISDIALTEDGKLIACNYMRCSYSDATVGTTRYYIWNDLASTPSEWFTSSMTANSTLADVGYTFAVKGTSDNAQVMTTAVHNNNRAARINLHTVVNGAETAYHRFGLHTSASEYTEAKQGLNFQLTATPLDNIWALEGELTDPTSFAVPATIGDPYTGTALKNTDLGKKYTGASYLNYDGHYLMVAPYANGEGKLAGVKVLGITLGFDDAISVATSTDLSNAIDATAAAATAYVDEDGDLTIYLIADAKVYAFSQKVPTVQFYTITVADSEGGSVEGGGTYEVGTAATLKAIPAEHYDFLNWTYGSETSTDNPLIVTVNGDMTITANFQEHAKYTINAHADDYNKGYVTGGGTEIYVGTELSLKATAKSGYYFAKWNDGNTDNPRTITVTGEAEYIAEFAVAYPRVYAYNLNIVDNGDSYTFSFKPNTDAINGNLVLYSEDGASVVKKHPISTPIVAHTATTITLNKTDLPDQSEVPWAIELSGNAITAFAEAFADSDFRYARAHAVIDNSPESEYFGRIYVADRRKTKSNSKVYVYNPDFTDFTNTNLGLATAGYSRPAVGTDGTLYLTGYTDGAEAGIFVVNPADLTKCTQFFNGTYDSDGLYKNNGKEIGSSTSGVGVYGAGKDAVLYTMMEDGSNANFNSGKQPIVCYQIGQDNGTVLKQWSDEPTWLVNYPATGKDSYNFGNNDFAATAKGVWVSQNKSNIDDRPEIAFVDKTGTIQLMQNSKKCLGGGMTVNADNTVLYIVEDSKILEYAIAWNENTPSLTLSKSYPISLANVSTLSMDYAGNLIACAGVSYTTTDENKMKVVCFTLPTDDNHSIVPAAKSKAIKLGARYTVTVVVNDDTMGEVIGAGSYKEGEIAELAAAPAANHRIVNWKKGDEVLSTELTCSFEVTEDVTINVTFEKIPQYTITTIASPDGKGTIIGGGTYNEGTEVELKATAHTGYTFVRWEDDDTAEATRTITVTGPVTYTAIFDKVAPRAWAYDLRMVEDGDNYKFTFKATSAGEATFLFTNKAGTPVAPTFYTVGSVEAGEKSVTIAQSEFGGTEDIYWSVQMDGAAIENMAEITDPTEGIYNFYVPQGVAVDNSPNSMYFGRIYVVEGTTGANDGGSEMAKQMTAGLFVYNQTLEKVQPATGYTGIIPQNVTFNTNKPTSADEINIIRQQMHRVAVDPVTGEVAFAYYKSPATAIYSMNPDDLAGNAQNLIEGSSITYANSLCFDSEGTLYVMNNANTGLTGGQIYKVQDDEVTLFAAHDKNNQWAVYDNAMASDGRGGLWIAQNRYGYDYPILSHVNKDGVVDFAVKENLNGWFPNNNTGSSYRGQLAYNLNENILAFAGNKMVTLFTVEYDGNGKPTINKLMSTPLLGGNIDGVAFDYAGDLYAASASSERLYKFVVPTNTNTCIVPAPASQVIKKEQRYTVTVSVNDEAMGTATGGGEYKAGETIMLTATANAGYRFVNWTYNNTTSTDNPLSLTVEGDISVTANFEEKPLEMVGVVKRAVQIGESVVVLTHETDGTPHLYKVVDGELNTEISQVGVVARDPDNAGDLLTISDIAATADGKLIAINKMVCQSDADQVATGYKRGETRVYIWNDLASNPTTWFTSAQSSNWYKSIQGHTMAVKGTSSNATVSVTGMNLTNGKSRYSIYTVKEGVYNGDANNNNDYYHFTKKDAVTPSTLGENYELNASPLGTDTWILDGGLVDPFEITDPLIYNTEVTVGATINENLGKKFNGATYLTVEDKHLMVAPYADANGKVAGVKVIDITNGLAAAQVLETLNLDDPAEATAAATAVLQDEYGLIITLVTDATLHRLEYTTAEVYTRSVTNGDFGTICLPYGSSNMTGAVFYEVAGQEPGKVYLDQVTTLEAGKPYIFRATASTITVVYEGDEALSPGNHNGLYGTFTDNTTVEQDNYIVYNNELRLCGTGCYINAYRAYLNLTAVTSDVPAPMPGRQRIGMNVQGGNETTALDNITEGNGTIIPTMEGTYDVLGRKLTQPTTTGVYIINGKKVFVVK